MNRWQLYEYLKGNKKFSSMKDAEREIRMMDLCELEEGVIEFLMSRRSNNVK